MTALDRWGPHALFPELTDLLESPFNAFRASAGHAIRVEDYLDDGKYVIRAELPGIDPNKDIDVTIANGVLKIQAERAESHKDAHRSEFRYGAFTRTVTLPTDASAEDVQARYENGILEITVKMLEPKPEAQHVTVETQK